MSQIYAFHSFMGNAEVVAGEVLVIPTGAWETVISKEVSAYLKVSARPSAWEGLKLVTTHPSLKTAMLINQDCPIQVEISVKGSGPLSFTSALPLSHIVAVSV